MRDNARHRRRPRTPLDARDLLGELELLAPAQVLRCDAAVPRRLGRVHLDVGGVRARPSPEVIIATRAFQGGFGALLIPQGFGLLKEVFPQRRWAWCSARSGWSWVSRRSPRRSSPACSSTPICSAPAGGWCSSSTYVGTAALIGGLRWLPRTASKPQTRLDLGGMTLIGLASVTLIYPLIEGRAEGWPAWTFAMLGAGMLLLLGFGLYQRRRREAPLIEPGLLRNRAYTDGIIVALGFFATFGGLLLTVSLFWQLGERFSPVHAGLTLVPLTAGMLASYGLVGRFGRHLLHLGIALSAAGVALLALALAGAPTAGTWALVPSLLVCGLGAGFVFGQLFDIILAGVTMDEVGSASGVLNAVQQLANALGVAGLGTIFFARLTAGHLPTDALQITAWAALVPLAVTFALAFRLPMRTRQAGTA